MLFVFFLDDSLCVIFIALILIDHSIIQFLVFDLIWIFYFNLLILMGFVMVFVFFVTIK